MFSIDVALVTLTTADVVTSSFVFRMLRLFTELVPFGET